MTGERHPSRPEAPEGGRRWDAAILTREDIGYGPARTYEYGYGRQQSMPRERRKRAGAPRPEPPPPGFGPFFGRLRRRRRPDHWIRAEVEEALFCDTWIDADRITVAVEDGVVTLTGMLAESQQVRRALRDARDARGVRRIRNRLEVGT